MFVEEQKMFLEQNYVIELQYVALYGFVQPCLPRMYDIFLILQYCCLTLPFLAVIDPNQIGPVYFHSANFTQCSKFFNLGENWPLYLFFTLSQRQKKVKQVLPPVLKVRKLAHSPLFNKDSRQFSTILLTFRGKKRKLRTNICS